MPLVSEHKGDMHCFLSIDPGLEIYFHYLSSNLKLDIMLTSIPEIRDLLLNLLCNHYRTFVASSGTF